MKKGFTLTMLFFFFSCILNAQQLKIAEKIEDLRGPVIEDHQGRLWFTGPDKIVSYKDGKWTEHKTPGKIKYLPLVTGLREPVPMAEDAKGNIWTVSKDGFLEYNGTDWKLYPYKDMSFDVTTNIFAANHGPVVFQNLKGQIAICDNGKWLYLNKDLPKEITRITEYGDNILLGSQEKVKEVGLYNKTYKLLTEGKEFNYFKCFLESSVIVDKEVKPGETVLLVIPLEVKENIYLSRIGESGFLMLYPDRLEIESNSGTKTINIPADYQKMIKSRDEINDFQQIGDYYYIATGSGLIRFNDDSFDLLNSSNGLSEDKVIRLISDYNGNLMAFHDKSVSILIHGQWKTFDDTNGFDFNFKGFHRTDIFKYNNKVYVINFLSPALVGKANICIYENNKWTTISDALRYRMPAISDDNKIWFYAVKGGKQDGICYLENNKFTSFLKDDGLEHNLVDILKPAGNDIWVTTYSLLNGKSFVHRLVFE